MPTIPYLQIRSRCAVAYGLPIETRAYNRRKNITKKGYSGAMTAHAAKRIRTCCEILVMRSPPKTVYNPITQRPCRFRLTFVTITISSREIIAHKSAYEKGLKPLMRWLRTKAGVTDYIWKAELQKRGQMHWHITTNTYIPWQWIRSAWNNVQKGNGWLDGFHAEFGHWSPNSTDIHAVGKVDKIDLYLAKYISKAGAKIDGKVWDCSNTLAGKKFFAFERDWDTDDLIIAAISSGEAKAKPLDNCTIIEIAKPENFIPQTQQKLYTTWKT